MSLPQPPYRTAPWRGLSLARTITTGWALALVRLYQLTLARVVGNTCRFHPTDQQLLLSAGYDKTVRLCDVATGTTLRTMHGHLRS